MSEDGAFARVIFKHAETTWVAKFDACLNAARKAGETTGGSANAKSGGWLTQHLFIMLAFMHTPESGVVNYKLSKKSLVETAVAFCMRGWVLPTRRFNAATIQRRLDCSFRA